MAYKNYWRSPENIENLQKWWDEELPPKRAPAYRCVREIRANGGSVLDVGCGTLQDYPLFLEQGWKYYGLEPSPDMIRAATARYPGVTIMEDDIVTARIPGSLFDLVYCMSVICHLPIGLVDTAIENMARISKRHLVISTPYVHADDQPTITENDPLGFIRNSFNYKDLIERVRRHAEVKSIQEFEDVVAVRAEVHHV